MTEDLHEEFERFYRDLWPMDMAPFKRSFTGSPDYAMEKTQEAWLRFPETWAAIKLATNARNSDDGDVWKW